MCSSPHFQPKLASFELQSFKNHQYLKLLDYVDLFCLFVELLNDRIATDNDEASEEFYLTAKLLGVRHIDKYY